MAVCCVDDLLHWFKDDKTFTKHIKSFEDDGHEFNWAMTVEQDVTAFLGIQVNQNEKDGCYKFTQTGLINKVLAATGMEHCNSKPAPCSGDGKHLGSDPEGALAKKEWSISSVVGMLLCLASNSRPDIAFATHQCVCFTHSPKASHEAAILRTCHHLQGTKKDDLIFTPATELNVDCYVDADFCGLFGVEDPADPISVKSRTGYVIMIAGCPLLWVSKLQQEISLSTQESEHVALSSSLRDVIPIQNLVKDVMAAVGLGVNKLTFAHVFTVFEDNNADSCLATTKKIAQKIDTDKQVAGCLTVSLESDKFVKV